MKDGRAQQTETLQTTLQRERECVMFVVNWDFFAIESSFGGGWGCLGGRGGAWF